MNINAFAPIADGVLFDDLHPLTQAEIDREIVAGRVYSTRFLAGGKTYGGTVIADTYTQACDRAAARDLGEIVDPRPLYAAGQLEPVAVGADQ
ncbi:hypothetical protein MNBD_ALPHA09-1890 [hydrothermal vent metagenome]|uniref:Uncharacterized protein n=1 Tax=hydrothermal vent metagenome TaxID=652676 RepID=A0A3B0TV12_9ZZZZ